MEVAWNDRPIVYLRKHLSKTVLFFVLKKIIEVWM